MRTYQQITQCFAVLKDPANPRRRAAFDLHVVTMIDPEDGTAHFADPRAGVRVMTDKQARAEGLDIPEIAAAFHSEALVEVDTLRDKQTRHEQEIEESDRKRHEVLAAASKEIATLRAKEQEALLLADEAIKQRDAALDTKK